jgi:hypothetical protein
VIAVYDVTCRKQEDAAMPEFAVYVTDHSDFPDKDVFYVFDVETIDDALEEASGVITMIQKGWGARLRVEFAMPAEAARLAVDSAGSVELRDSFELTSYAARLHR